MWSQFVFIVSSEVKSMKVKGGANQENELTYSGNLREFVDSVYIYFEKHSLQKHAKDCDKTFSVAGSLSLTWTRTINLMRKHYFVVRMLLHLLRTN